MFERSFLGGSNSGGPVRSKGVGKFLEIIMDNTARFLVSNLICLLCLLPGAAGVLWSLNRDNPALLLAAGLLGGVLFGPAYGAMSDGMLYAVRGLPGNWLKRYFHAWKRDWTDGLLPGGILGALAALLVYEFFIAVFGDGSLPVSIYVCTGITVAVASAVFTYYWPQRVFSDLKNRQIFRNCLLLLMAHPLLGLKAALIHMAYWGAMTLLVPYSALFLALFGFWLPALLGLLAVYPQLDKDFRIEERSADSIEQEEEDDEPVDDL